MIKDPLISIIVPIYNVEKYIHHCIDSLLNQTYSNIEILLIDDGSPDLCGEICEEYKHKDSRINVYHKDNGGLSDARNYGIEHCRGEYITFVDSDDSIDLDFCSYLMQNTVKNNADIYCISLRKVNEKFESINGNCTNQIKRYNSYDAIQSMFLKNGLTWCAQGKLYKKELFKNIRFPFGALMEDKGTTYKIFDIAGVIVFDDTFKYNYTVRPNSIVHSNFSYKLLDSFRFQLELNDFIEKKYINITPLAYGHTVKTLVYLISGILCKKQDIREEIAENLFEQLFIYYSKSRNASNLGFLYKSIALFYMFSYKLLKKRIYKSQFISYVSQKIYGKYSR